MTGLGKLGERMLILLDIRGHDQKARLRAGG